MDTPTRTKPVPEAAAADPEGADDPQPTHWKPSFWTQPNMKALFSLFVESDPWSIPHGSTKKWWEKLGGGELILCLTKLGARNPTRTNETQALWVSKIGNKSHRLLAQHKIRR